MSDEKRKHKREEVKVLVTEKKKNKTVVTHKTGDVSDGGISVNLDAPTPLSEEAEYIFQLPTSDDFINVKGKIVYRESKDGSSPGKYGIEFQDLDEDALKQIQKFIRSKNIDKS